MQSIIHNFLFHLKNYLIIFGPVLVIYLLQWGLYTLANVTPPWVGVPLVVAGIILGLLGLVYLVYLLWFVIVK